MVPNRTALSGVKTGRENRRPSPNRNESYRQIVSTYMKGYALLFGILGAVGCQSLAMVGADGANGVNPAIGSKPGHAGRGTPLISAPGDELAAFSGGCFWGTERAFRHVAGVVATAVGYTGGHTTFPSYEEVCSHTTGHAETVLVEFDPKKVTYNQLLATFWNVHDPTTLNRQGPDVGDSYRSAIWTITPEQLKEAQAAKAEDQKKETAPIVTEIRPLGRFWLAEDYHQQYDEKTGTNTCPLPRHGG